jgi:protein involved in sex pheromone biosynthesis
MKKIIAYSIVILLLISVCTCGKQSRQDMTGAKAGEESSFEVTLNQELLDRYIKTLPPFIKKAKEEGKNAETMGAAWLFGEELIGLLNDYGWNKPEEFAQVHTKVWAVTPWLIATGKME